MADYIPEVLLHPEVELRMKILGNEWGYPDKELVTSLDLLEVYPGGKAIIKKDMGDTDFAEYCNTNDFTRSDGPLLRVFFVEELYLPPPVDSPARPTNPDDPDTALLMHEHFGVPMLFFLDQLDIICQQTIGNVTFVRRNKEGREVSLDGYYQFLSEYYTDKCGYIWFSQSFDPQTRASNYIVHKAPAITKRLIFECAQGPNWLSLTRPFAIDVFTMNDCVRSMSTIVGVPRGKLIDIEKVFARANHNHAHEAILQTSILDLHGVARQFRLVQLALDPLKEVLDYLHDALNQISDPGHSFQKNPGSTQESIFSSLVLLKSQVKGIVREVSYQEDRTKLRIDLGYTLENQRDSRTNLKIARLTGNIAVSSQKDSSSMITMAAVTMFFLPATFVSALFSSTVFFTEGKLTVPPQWWIFPVITIPLTILVFGVWLVWKRRRNIIGSTELDELKIDDPEKGAPDSITSESSEEASITRSSRPWGRLLPAFLSKKVDLKWHKVE